MRGSLDRPRVIGPDGDRRRSAILAATGMLLALLSGAAHAQAQQGAAPDAAAQATPEAGAQPSAARGVAPGAEGAAAAGSMPATAAQVEPPAGETTDAKSRSQAQAEAEARAMGDMKADAKAEAGTRDKGSGDASSEKGGARESAAGESVDHAMCRLIEAAAEREGLPTSFLTRLIWRESSFRPDVVSHAGAQGIAQFMPATAKARGLENPFDPEAAIPASAHLLADLNRQFGNLGLAAAAYNAGPGRVSGFLAGGGLPAETRTYVRIITGQSAEDWALLKRQGGEAPSFPPEPCLATVARLRKGGPPPDGFVNELFAPWGVQISGNFSRSVALASFRREIGKFKGEIADLRPMIIATRLGGRGSRVFYRVRLPAETRAEATRLCDRLRKAGGACLVLPN